MSSLQGTVYPARRCRGGGGDLHVDGEDDTGEGTRSVKSKTKAAAAAKIRVDNMVRRRRRERSGSAAEVFRWCCVVSAHVQL